MGLFLAYQSWMKGRICFDSVILLTAVARSRLISSYNSGMVTGVKAITMKNLLVLMSE